MTSWVSTSSSVATSFATNVAFVSPHCDASALATARPSSEKSMPVNRLAGNSFAITLMAWPLPQPMSATSAPARSSSGEALGHRKDDIDERGVERLAARLGHQLVEPRILAVGQSATGGE